MKKGKVFIYVFIGLLVSFVGVKIYLKTVQKNQIRRSTEDPTELFHPGYGGIVCEKDGIQKYYYHDGRLNRIAHCKEGKLLKVEHYHEKGFLMSVDSFEGGIFTGREYADQR